MQGERVVVQASLPLPQINNETDFEGEVLTNFVDTVRRGRERGHEIFCASCILTSQCLL